MWGYRPRKVGLETRSTELEYLREEVNLIVRDDQDGFEEYVEEEERDYRYQRVSVVWSIFNQRAQVRRPEPIHTGWGQIPTNGSYTNWPLKTMEEVLKKRIQAERKKLVQVSRENDAKERIILELRRKVDQLKLKEENELLEGGFAAGAFSTAHGIIGIGRSPMEIFPKEVWGMILEKLTDWTARRECVKACALFRKILDPAASKCMLFEVFPDLHNYLGEDEDSCIEVCRVAAVNQFLEDITTRPQPNPAETSSDTFHIGHLRRSSNGLITKFDVCGNGLCEGDVTCVLVKNTSEEWRMCNLYPQYHVYESINDIRGRNHHDSCIELDVIVNDYFGSSRAGPGRVTTFLQSYGEHIRRLTVDYLASDSTDLAKLLTVDQMRYLPNLRKLCLGRNSFTPYYRRRKLGANSMLKGSQLETVQFADGWSFVEDYSCCGRETILDPVVYLLLRSYHSQLGRQDLSDEVWKEVYWYGWPSLTELYVTGDSNLNTDFILRTKISSYRTLRASMPNLKKLGLRIAKCPSLDLRQHILEAISELCTTTQLNTLRLSFVEEGFQSWGSLILPPTLKSIEVEHHCSPKQDRSRTCYSFLHNFPSLQNLFVFPDSSDYIKYGQGPSSSGDISPPAKRREEFEMVEVHKYVYDGEMYRSNIWELLPQLKLFTFHEDIYTRKGYYEKFTGSDGPGLEEPEYFELITDSIIIIFRQK